MATYCYTTDDGETVDRDFPMGRAPESVKLDDGREAKRDFSAEWSSPKKYRGGADRWLGFTSTAMGVLPTQRKEAAAEAKRVGVPTHYDEQGDPVFESRGHRKRFMEAMGYVDKDGGYGDATEMKR